MRPIDADALKEAFEEDGHLSAYIEEFIDEQPTLSPDEDLGLTPEEIEDRQDVCLWISEERFCEIIKAEADGRLVVLPCKVGDTVWGVIFDTRDCPHCVGLSGCFGCSKANPVDVYRTDFKLHMVEKIGKTVFLTRAEAEAAMKGVSENG